METPEFVTRRTKKWNRVSKFMANPCDAPTMAYVETFFPAAGKAVITLLSFGLDDVARGFFRPKGLYPKGCLGRNKRRRGAIGIPEVGEEIGKRIPGAETVKSRQYGGLEKNLWLLDGLAQRVLFWFMVIDVITDFSYDWTSGIYKKKFCEDAGSSQLVTTDYAQTFGMPPSGGWHTTHGGFTVTIRNAFYNGAWSAAFPRGKSGSAFCQWTFTTDEIGGAIFDVHLNLQPIYLGENGLIDGPVQAIVRQIIMGSNEVKTISLQASGELTTAVTFCDNATGRFAVKLDVFQVSAS